MYKIIGHLVIVFFSLALAKAAEVPETQSEKSIHRLEGNFIVPYWQQPRPLIGFGQNILKNDEEWIITSKNLYWNTTSGYATEQSDYVIYGPSTDFSLLCALPVAERLKYMGHHSSGLEDMLFQAEYAFFYDEIPNRTQQATIVTSLTAPTGDPRKKPPTGLGTPSVFIGGTYNYTTTNWYFFASGGEVLTSAYHQTKAANLTLYQGGVGRHLITLNKNWYFALISELDGYYAEQNFVNGVFDADSGRDVIYLTNSIYIASHSSGLLMRLGMGFPIYQQMHSKTTRERYVLGGQIAIGF